MKTSPRHRNAFTLLEMMLSVAVFVILVTSAFSLVGATTELMTEVSEVQNEAALKMRFIETCRVAFESMTSHSDTEFHYFNRGGDRFDTYLSIINAPEAFDFGLNLRDEIERVVLAAEIQPGGFIRAGVYYMTEIDFEAAQKSDFAQIESPYIELIPRLRQLSWRFYDPQARKWIQTLDGGRKTSLTELSLQIAGGQSPIRTVFWHVSEEQ